MWPPQNTSKLSHQHVGPSSPPESPRAASPVFGRKKSSPHSGPLPPPGLSSRPMAPPPLSTNYVAVNGPGLGFHHHPAARTIHPDQLSPRTTSSSSPAPSTSPSDLEDSEEDDDVPNTSGMSPPSPDPPSPQQTRIGQVVAVTGLVIEELSDFGDSDDERAGVVRPCAIEYAESDRSRSGSRTRPEIDSKMMYNLCNLNCGGDSSSSDLDEDEYQEFLIKRRAERRRHRMSSGSLGKRTLRESIGSDTDREDIRSMIAAGIEEAGSAARRLRRRVGDRRSLQFQDPPPPRIDELDEPDSSEDEILIGEVLARELPYYEYVSMEVDSP
ncbi:hypothetical protein VTJ83DRAFT_3170 [Remersonia thermophila]|uniref:Uncharacterized protein n=1 Tax=Remersonia thermophila TaxID=72144 RepID=A0ABR4DE55_9PEZI